MQSEVQSEVTFAEQIVQLDVFENGDERESAKAVAEELQELPAVTVLHSGEVAVIEQDHPEQWNEAWVQRVGLLATPHPRLSEMTDDELWQPTPPPGAEETQQKRGWFKRNR